jgi:hypothetical protein
MPAQTFLSLAGNFQLNAENPVSACNICFEICHTYRVFDRERIALQSGPVNHLARWEP